MAMDLEDAVIDVSSTNFQLKESGDGLALYLRPVGEGTL
jgi:hypothetical protein